MSSRLDYDGDNAFLTEIKSLQTDIAELKSRQSIPHTAVTHGYVTQNASGGLDVTNYAMAANSTHQFNLTFYGDGSQPYPYGVQFSQVYDGATQLSDYVQADSNGVYYSWAVAGASSDPNNPWIWWGILVYTRANAATISIRFRTLTSCKGYWSASW